MKKPKFSVGDEVVKLKGGKLTADRYRVRYVGYGVDFNRVEKEPRYHLIRSDLDNFSDPNAAWDFSEHLTPLVETLSTPEAERIDELSRAKEHELVLLEDVPALIMKQLLNREKDDPTPSPKAALGDLVTYTREGESAVFRVVGYGMFHSDKEGATFYAYTLVPETSVTPFSRVTLEEAFGDFLAREEEIQPYTSPEKSHEEKIEDTKNELEGVIRDLESWESNRDLQEKLNTSRRVMGTVRIGYCVHYTAVDGTQHAGVVQGISSFTMSVQLEDGTWVPASNVTAVLIPKSPA